MSKPKRRRRPTRLAKMLGLAVVLILGWVIYDSNPPITTAENKQLPVLESGPSMHSPPAGSRLRIVIDAGHGGGDPGAEGVSGRYEKEFTLAVAQKVSELLEQQPQFEVFMTRGEDTFIELVDRAEIANELEADAFISIHGNTFIDDSKVSGTETYYYDEDSIPLARALHTELVDALGLRDRGLKQEEWAVLTHNNSVSVLLELGFLTNPSDEATLLTGAAQNRAAQAIASGLEKYFGIHER